MSENLRINMSYIMPNLKLLLFGTVSGTALQYISPENITSVLDILVYLAQIACYVVGTWAGIKTIKKVKDTTKKL